MDATLSTLSAAQLHKQFLELLPFIETHGQITFRYLRCPHRRADALQEMRALGWLWHLQLAQRGKDAREFVASFVTFLARSVKCGRRLAGMEKSKDALCQQAQQRHGFCVQALPFSLRAPIENLYGDPHSQEIQDALEEILQDNTQTPVPEQVAFRQDFPAWRRTRCQRDRRVIEDLILGERTLDVADKYGMSPGRVSQLRRDFMEDWTRFTDAEPAGAPAKEVG